MTDPNIPPPERVVHQTTINTASPERKGGGGLMAFILGGLIVAVAVIGWFLYSGGRPAAPERPEVNLDINIPAPKLPETPHLPDRPVLPDVPRPAEPPTVAAPSAEPQG